MRDVARPPVAAALLLAMVAGCGGGPGAPPVRTPSPIGSSATAAPIATTPTGAAAPTGPPAATGPTGTANPPGASNGATPPPVWLGTRVLPKGPDGYGRASGTPKELRTRRIVTTDLLPPPVDGRFHARVTTVPDEVRERSTWTPDCPVPLNRLRYVQVSFRGFDGRAHTGELLVNRSVADDVVTVFRRLFAAGWPIEEMRITSPADVAAPATGDGNDTSAFVCRPVRGSTSWSQHAYGLAIDLNPFQNPYVSGRTVLPELARAYLRRDRRAPGLNTPSSPAVRAFRAVGWGWGGDYRTKQDYMHFSLTGG